MTLTAEAEAKLDRIAALEALTDTCPAPWCEMPACGDCALCLTGWYRNCTRDSTCKGCGGLGRVARAPDFMGVEVRAVSTTDGAALELKVSGEPVWSPFDGRTELRCFGIAGSGSWEQTT